MSIIRVILILVLCFHSFGCSGTQEKAEPSPEAQEEYEEEEEGYEEVEGKADRLNQKGTEITYERVVIRVRPSGRNFDGQSFLFVPKKYEKAKTRGQFFKLVLSAKILRRLVFKIRQFNDLRELGSQGNRKQGPYHVSFFDGPKSKRSIYFEMILSQIELEELFDHFKFELKGNEKAQSNLKQYLIGH